MRSYIQKDQTSNTGRVVGIMKSLYWRNSAFIFQLRYFVYVVSFVINFWPIIMLISANFHLPVIQDFFFC